MCERQIFTNKAGGERVPQLLRSSSGEHSSTIWHGMAAMPRRDQPRVPRPPPDATDEDQAGIGGKIVDALAGDPENVA
jgi:hypothetical protein